MADSPGFGLIFIDSNDIELGKVLGRGGFGTVYIATHVNWGKVAVKRILNIRMTESLQKEADKMVRSLTSPYLVRIMGLMETPNGLDIVMEFFEYGSLKEFEEKYMKCECWARKVKMVQDIAFGMNFLHTLRQPITHCDLKLENVFVADGFRAKIGDLGLAVSSSQSRQAAGSSGTVSHMPPEAFQKTDIEPDEAWDIFTFGITAYELTSGRDPWPQLKTFANAGLVAIWVGKGHRPNLDAIPSDAPTELVDIITSCWVAKTTERPRFTNILDLVTKLFETNYERNLRKADRAISDQMDLVQESSERKAQSTDSGWGSLEVRGNKKQHQDTATSAKSSSSSSREKETSTADAVNDVFTAESKQGTTDRSKECQADVTNNDMQLQYKHTVDTPDSVYSFCWINPNHLACCMTSCVKVYEVTTTSSHLAYTITSKKWKPLFGEPRDVNGIAVSEALPGSMMVICRSRPYVYQIPCHEATKIIKRYKILCDEWPDCSYPSLIEANATVAILMETKSCDYVLTICNLPDFTQRSKLNLGSCEFVNDLCITSEHLVVMWDTKIEVRKLAGNTMQNVCEIQLPEHPEDDFSSVCCVDTDAREFYAACEDVVYKYILNETGNEKELTCMKVGRVTGTVNSGGLSLTSHGLMAIRNTKWVVSLYKLE